MKKIFFNNFIFILYSFTLFIFSFAIYWSIKNNDYKMFTGLGEIEKYIMMIPFVTIFIIWMSDKKYKFKYFFIYLIAFKIISFLIDFLVSLFEVNWLLKTIIIFTSFYVYQLIYNFLRDISYRTNKRE